MEAITEISRRQNRGMEGFKTVEVASGCLDGAWKGSTEPKVSQSGEILLPMYERRAAPQGQS